MVINYLDTWVHNIHMQKHWYSIILHHTIEKFFFQNIGNRLQNFIANHWFQLIFHSIKPLFRIVTFHGLSKWDLISLMLKSHLCSSECTTLSFEISLLCLSNFLGAISYTSSITCLFVTCTLSTSLFPICSSCRL